MFERGRRSYSRPTPFNAADSDSLNREPEALRPGSSDADRKVASLSYEEGPVKRKGFDG